MSVYIVYGYNWQDLRRISFYSLFQLTQGNIFQSLKFDIRKELIKRNLMVRTQLNIIINYLAINNLQIKILQRLNSIITIYKVDYQKQNIQYKFKIQLQSVLNSQRIFSNKSQQLTLSYQKYGGINHQHYGFILIVFNIIKIWMIQYKLLSSIQERIEFDELKDFKDIMRQKSTSVFKLIQNNDDNKTYMNYYRND
ncbi:unnamed protein product [Paramecium pentaurelia]|uniref:Uncharacterized protein n=1 Tax=Paramecium pentaurelia TaxID=43138 RepID=A0A8S1TWC5_9CILI|nr:unnamed protein product [Paramecium pentaurelia]